ncbi:MAG: co-chaperone GroES [Chloroflexota bacterium]|nr:co-chaperone GroES [Chloroflexota bacterium]
MALKIAPLADRVVVKLLEEEKKTKGGIILPDTAKEKPQRGVVEAVGPGKMDDSGKHIQMDIKKGDEVIYQKYTGTEIKENDKEYLILRESDILAKIG